jgi:hypothetical protein
MSSGTSRSRRRTSVSLFKPCRTHDQLHAWVENFLDLIVPRGSVCPGHDAPFDYLAHAYFEPTKDVVVWAPRGGGKTRLAAVATLLDLLHKPLCAIRILGGSLEQSLRMWEHLLPDIERLAPGLIVKRRSAARRITLTNGCSAAVLTQTQRAVRGLRVQKLRCDEVEMFKPAIWEAAQLVSRSQGKTSGAVEAISTFHATHGLMSRIVDDATRNGTRLIRWCLLEVLERCPPARDCGTCPLWDDCRGIAKEKCDGFVSIDDAIAMKRRVSVETWDSEMLCRRPSTKACVFPTFVPEIHVRELSLSESGCRSLGIDFGFAAPFVCLWIECLPDGTTFVFDEYVQPGRTVSEHLEQIESLPWGKPRRVCCDPSGAGRNDQTAASNVQVLRSAGYIVKTRHSLIQEGLELIRSALKPASGEPRLFIHPRCTRLIKAMQCYHYAPGGSELPLKDGEHDHLIDALRYYFVNTAMRGDVNVRAY